MQPPSKVFIGQIFRIKVKATLADGSSLPRAIINCNISQGVDFKSISTLSKSLDVNQFIQTSVNISSLPSPEQLAYQQALNISGSNIDTKDPAQVFELLNKKLDTVPGLSPTSVESLKADYLNLFLKSVDKQSYLYLFGKGDILLDSLSSIGQRTGVRIESIGGTVRTDQDGVAALTFQFIAGPSDKYYLRCQSGQAYTANSAPISLINAIKNIRFLDNFTDEIQYHFVRDDKKRMLPTFIPFPKIVNISMVLESIFPQDIYAISIKLLKYKDFASALSTAKIDVGNLTSDQIDLINSYTQKVPEVQDRLNRLWNIITTGANSLLNSLGGDKTVPSKNAVLFKVSANGSLYTMNNLEVQFKNPGLYQLILTVNGIESKRSNVIEVVDIPNPNQTFLEKYSTSILMIILYPLCLFVCLVNLIEYHVYISFIAIIFDAAAIYMVFIQTAYEIYFVVFMLITLFLLTINLLIVIYMKLFGEEAKLTHEFYKRAIYHEYTFQRIFNRPSMEWVYMFLINFKIEAKNFRNTKYR